MTDRTLEDTFYKMFTTRAFATGIPTVLAGSPVVSAYEDGSTTQITAGITLGVSHDSVVGLNLLTIAATEANGYEKGKDYNLVITTGTVGGVSVVGEVVGSFSLGLSAAAVDLANATDGLGAIKTDTAAILIDTDDLHGNQGDWATATGFATSGALATVDSNVDAIKAKTDDMTFTVANSLDCTVVFMDADTVTASAMAADAVTEIQSGLATSSALATVDANVDAILVDTGTTLPDQLDSMSGATFSSATDSLEAIRDRGDAAWTTGAGGSAPTVEEIRIEMDDNSTQFQAIRAKTDDLTFTVANQVDANAVAISGDTVAADNLELQYDTTGLTGDTFPATQSQVGNLSTGTAATSVVASTAVITTGTQTLTYTATAALDGVTHDIAPDGGNTDFYYEFDVGANGVPVGIQWQGYANSNGDEYIFTAYNWVSDGFDDQVGSKAGTPGSTIVTEELDLTTSHVGTGANAGKVRLQVTSADGTKFATDRILCSFATVYQSVSYDGGAVWVDTIDGVAGTADFVNGVADNPVLTWADALTIATSIGLHKFHIVNGSTITLTADTSNAIIEGEKWTLNLNGQIISGAYFHGAVVNGIGVNGGDGPFFSYCDIETVSLPGSSYDKCALSGPITCTEAAIYFFEASFSAVAGTTTPVFDFGAAIGNSDVNFRHYSGGIEVENMKAGDLMSLEGDGQLKINANCTGGTIAIRGNFKVTDSAGGVVTLSDDARIDIGQINAQCDLALADYDPATSTELAAVDAKVDIIDTNVDAILVDTGTTLPDQINALNDFNPATDTVANVTLVDTTTTNTDMRGTDGANTVAPDNASITLILADTNELQTNQSNWLTATGFATEGALAVVDANVDLILEDTSTTIPALISGLNDIAATDIVSAGAITTLNGAVVNVDLVDTTTTNTDMRGTDSANTIAPDNASIAAILVDTDELQGNQGDWATATGFATDTALSVVDANVDLILEDTSTTLPAQISALNNISVSDVLAGVIEGTVTLKQSLQLSNAASAGKASGMSTSNAILRDLADTKDRIDATVDASGNRTSVTRDYD